MAASNAESRRTEALRNRARMDKTVHLIRGEIKLLDELIVEVDARLERSPRESLIEFCELGWKVVLKCKQLLGLYRVECEKNPEIADEIGIEIEDFSFRLQVFSSDLLDATDRIGG